MNSQKLPLRKGVGVLILNDDNKIFVGNSKKIVEAAKKEL